MLVHVVRECILFYPVVCLISSPIDVEEDEAIEEAIRRNLSEESVQSSLQNSRYTCIAHI